jgi:hypothetical protein
MDLKVGYSQQSGWPSAAAEELSARSKSYVAQTLPKEKPRRLDGLYSNVKKEIS